MSSVTLVSAQVQPWECREQRGAAQTTLGYAGGFVGLFMMRLMLDFTGVRWAWDGNWRMHMLP